MKNEYFGQKSPSASLHRSVFILQHRADNLLIDAIGVGLSQARIMGQLHQTVARSQKIVAMMLHQTEANVSRQLQVMKKQGLVNISRNPKDKRVREITLTTKGAKANQKAQAVLDGQIDQLVKILGKAESRTFRKAIDILGKTF